MKLIIPEPRLSQPSAGGWRVAANVGGEEIYFESAVELTPRVEAWVCALMMPAMLRGWALDVRAPLSAVFTENLRQARVIARRWWPQLRAGEIRATVASERERVPGQGLFFTGGVDSSFAFRHLHRELGALVYVEGFDVELTDTARLRRVRESLQRVAAVTGQELIVVRTNLRRHRVFRALHWETAHAAALGAVAQTLSNRLGTVYLADSDVPAPFGSQPELDPLWSSDAVRLASFGAGHSRLQRVKAICQWPPLRGHLRVCWENLAETLNCGRCKKCLLTRLQLWLAGDRTEMGSFPEVPLAETLERVAQTNPGTDYPHFWREVREAVADEGLRDSIERLLNHRPAAPERNRLKRWWQRVLGGIKLGIAAKRSRSNRNR